MDSAKKTAARITHARTGRRRISSPIFATALGRLYCGHSERVLATRNVQRYKGQVQLVLTSPPFPLSTQKKYGNFQGEAYIEWFAQFAPLLRDYLAPSG